MLPCPAVMLRVTSWSCFSTVFPNVVCCASPPDSSHTRRKHTTSPRSIKSSAGSSSCGKRKCSVSRTDRAIWVSSSERPESGIRLAPLRWCVSDLSETASTFNEERVLINEERSSSADAKADSAAGDRDGCA